jgi:hypothetical protein
MELENEIYIDFTPEIWEYFDDLIRLRHKIYLKFENRYGRKSMPFLGK